MRSFVGWRAAILGVLALLLQTWLPLVHHPASYLGLDATGATICLAGEHQQPGNHTPDQSSSDQAPCTICQALHAASLFTPPPAIHLVAGIATFHPYSVVLIPVDRPSRITEPAARPRAPPQQA